MMFVLCIIFVCQFANSRFFFCGLPEKGMHAPCATYRNGSSPLYDHIQLSCPHLRFSFFLSCVAKVGEANMDMLIGARKDLGQSAGNRNMIRSRVVMFADLPGFKVSGFCFLLCHSCFVCFFRICCLVFFNF